MVFALGFDCQRYNSLPLGSPPLFILLPNGNPVLRLMPRYRLLNALAVPLQE
jgi:hypothetical protein